jgi:hypothetical protein
VIDPRFAILGALITVAGSASYARDTLRGRTQPNRVTWMLWTVAPLIAFAAEVAQGVGLASLLTLAVGVGPLLVVIASFLDPRAYYRLTRFDGVCAGLSVAALVAWGLTGTGDVAIVFSILADLFGLIPTLRKARRDPASESASAFLASGCGSVITVITVPAHAWTFATVGFPLYILAADVTITWLILVPRHRRPASAAGDEPRRRSADMS